jgi:hypothetical protein
MEISYKTLIPMGDYNGRKKSILNITKFVITLLLEMVGATGFEPATS